ncbi:MAG: hypothetical protein ABUS57_11165 [Pseudomonadota bacterium]
MLDQRPLLQRTVYASGAFALVFSAAMAGSAIMITGGLFPGHLRVSSASADTPQQSLWSAPALGESAPPYVYDAAQTYAAQTPSAPEPAYQQAVGYDAPRAPEAVDADLDDPSPDDADSDGSSEKDWDKLERDITALNDASATQAN